MQIEPKKTLSQIYIVKNKADTAVDILLKERSKTKLQKRDLNLGTFP